MKKKVSAAVVVAAVALMIVPTMSSASVYRAGGTLVPEGTELVGQSGEVEFAVQTPGGGIGSRYYCTSSEWRGTLVQNQLQKTAKTRITSYSFGGGGVEGKCAGNIYGSARIS